MSVSGSRGAGSADVTLVSLNSTALRTELIDNISGVFGTGAFLSMENATGESAGKVLRDALGANLARVIDLFHEMDENGDGTIGKAEFRRALARIVESPPSREDSDALFDEIDLDKGGTIEYKELHKLLRRRTSDRGPRKPLWEARQPRAKHLESAGKGGGLGNKGPQKREPMPVHDITHAALSFTRSEAVLLGQRAVCDAETEALSRRRVVALNQLTESIDRTTIKEMEKLEALHRQETQAAGRMRGQRVRSAKERQARAIAESGAFTRSMHKRPASSSAALLDYETMSTSATYPRASTAPGSPSLRFGSGWWQAQGTAASWTSMRPRTAMSLSDECFASSLDLGNTSSVSATFPAQTRSRSSSPSRTMLLDDQQSPVASSSGAAFAATAFLPSASCGSLGLVDGGSSAISGFRSPLAKSDSRLTASAASIARLPATRRPRMQYQSDVGRPLVPAPAARATYVVLSSTSIARAINAPREDATTPSSFVSSLRCPSGEAAGLVPILPRPKHNEALRAGHFTKALTRSITDNSSGRVHTDDRYLSPERRAERDAELALKLKEAGERVTLAVPPARPPPKVRKQTPKEEAILLPRRGGSRSGSGTASPVLAK